MINADDEVTTRFDVLSPDTLVSVIYVFDSEADDWQAVVESVANQAYTNVQLMLVDRASSPSFSATLDPYYDRFAEDALVQVPTVVGETMGQYLNVALRQAQGDALLFIHAPLQVNLRDWVATLRDKIDVGMVVASAGLHLENETSPLAFTEAFARHSLDSFPASLLRRTLLSEVGLCKPSFDKTAYYHLLFRAGTAANVWVMREESSAVASHKATALPEAKERCSMYFDLSWRHALPEVRGELRTEAEQARGDYFVMAIKQFSPLNILRALLYYSPL